MADAKLVRFKWRFIGLSSEDKPTPDDYIEVSDGVELYEADTSKEYIYYNNQWYEKTTGGGGGGGGTTNYNQLSNKPQINSITLSGNKSLDDLGIQAKINAEHKLSADNVDDTNTTNKFVTTSDKTTWNGKQDALVSGTNIKTINNQSILGNGNIEVGGNAVLYTEQTLTTAQQEQARANIGAVSLDEIGTVFTLKGEVGTVADLPASGNHVGDVYYVQAVSAGYIWLTSTSQPNGYWEELGETIDLSVYELKPVVNAPTGTSVTITPEDNHIYNCGELTSLTITNPPADGMYIIIFTSGATPTTTTIPATIHGFDSFAAEANMRYEINVLNNYALIAGWEVTV